MSSTDVIAVIDYGMGNLHSVAKALEKVAPGQQVRITSDPAVVAGAGRVVFPGQGAMPDCIKELDARGLRAAVIAAAAEKPFLGICVGLQMLFEHSEEGPVDGLGILSGCVRRFPIPFVLNGQRLKIPHMGWNGVHQNKEKKADRSHPLFTGIADETRFYFVHSYYVEPEETGIIAGKTEHGFLFTSAVARDNIFAIQSHPEKSAAAGLGMLENFVRWKP